MKKIKRIVGQSNELVRNIIYNKLDINDLKVFKAIVSKINYRDSLFSDFYQVNYNELDIVGVSRRNRYDIVTKCLEKLSSTFVTIKNKNDDTIRLGLITNKFIFPKNTTIVTMSIHKELEPYLLDLKDKYTKYGLEYISTFKNVYTLKLYELLRSFMESGKYEATIDNLRKSLEIEDGKYPQYANFKSRILTPSLKIINDSTDIKVESEEQKGYTKKIRGIKFTITDKNKKVDKTDLTKLIDKVFIDKSGNKYMTRKFIPDEKKRGYYNLELLNLKTLKDITLPESLKKDELFELIIGKIKK